MTTKADLTPEEWELIATAPTGAGLIVASASRGGTFKESFSMAKAYTEARQQHGESELLDELVATRPKVDRTRSHSVEELKEHHLERLREAISVVEQKATPEEADDYKKFVRGLAEGVAAAHEEGGEAVSGAEQSVVDEIGAALGS
jgi:hypothetical protein